MVHPGTFHKVVQVVTLPLLVGSFVLHPAVPFQTGHNFFSKICFTTLPSDTDETTSSISGSVAPRPTRCASILADCSGWNLEWGALGGRTKGCVDPKFKRGLKILEVLVIQI